MHPDEWNREDALKFEIDFPCNAMDRGFEGLEEMLEIIEATGEDFRPRRMSLNRRKLKYSRQKLRERLHEATFQKSTSIHLLCDRFSETWYSLGFFEGHENVRSSVILRVNPFMVFSEPDKGEERAQHLLNLARVFASRFPVTYGFAHSITDAVMDMTDEQMRELLPQEIDRVHWLNLYGPRMVESIGRERMLSTPAFLLEELPGGAVLWLTRPTPVDFASEEARLAQARALVHLRPELKLEDTLATLRHRSLAFVPVEPRFDSDIADLLTLTLQRSGLHKKHWDVERLNQYHPPQPSEWLPAHQAPKTDVPDVPEAIRLYEHQYAEQLAALLHTEVPSVMKGSPESLPQIDYFLWWRGWGHQLPEAERELLIDSLGAYLGMVMVHTLGGTWVPRRKQAEAAVIVGDKAWLPFLRARHLVQSRQAVLDFSLTQLFRHARRSVR
ncbi:hypothetical protein [Hyalangium versicolor]|uniref:hypothetical protein n=1 Tax=Hyalangium versicolor TaxID=2861190 RepID=UPI001CCA19A6|nr:hypothetical protein [Hyalangium versicolor]